jgi:hypothetical protein
VLHAVGEGGVITTAPLRKEISAGTQFAALPQRNCADAKKTPFFG